MRLPPCLRALHRSLPALIVACAGLAAPARADAIRVVAADERGLTLQLDVPAFALAPGEGGRFEVTGTGLGLLSEPGRARLPYASALIAIPPGARVSAAVVGGSAEEVRDRVQLVVGDKPGFRDERGGMGLVPTREPVPAIADGSWPPAAVEVGEPFVVRGQTMVAVQIRPFRYDEAQGRLWARRSVSVRLSFAPGAGAAGVVSAPAVEDRHWDPVLKRTLLNYEQGRRWRVAPPRGRAAGPGASGSLFERPGRSAAPAAFDETEPEVRVGLDTTGVYGFEFTQLEAAGFPAGVPIGELSVHRHEFSGFGSPPYVTIELPIEVEEGPNRNGVFDEGDRVILWVQNWAQRSRASLAQRAWGDTERVYVTRKRGGAGLRVALRPGWRGSSPPVLASYPWTRRWERNFYHVPTAPDTNTDQFFWTNFLAYYDRPDSFRFETNHLDPARNVSLAITLQGRATNPHYTWCDVGNGSGQFATVADSAFWVGRGEQTFSATLPGPTFSEGATDRVRVWGRTNPGAPNPAGTELASVSLNYFEATYWRRYRALDHILACNSGDASGEYEIQAGGFPTDSIRAYDVTDSLNPIRLTDVVIQQPPGDHVLKLQALASGVPRAYVIFDRPRLLPDNRFETVTRRQLYAQGAADYLLVVPEAFLSAAQPLAALRRAEGLNVLVAPLESVNDEFNGGRRSSYAIRRFVRYAYDNWNASFVLLMGDGSEDPRRLLNTSTPDWIPIQKVFGPVSVFSGSDVFREIVPGDLWFVWSVDTPPSPGAALLPDLAVGRLPVNSLQQATDVVAKLVAYESVDTTQTWRRRLLLHSDDSYSGATTFGGGPGGVGYCFRSEELAFARINRAIQAVVSDSAGLSLCEPEQFDLNVYLQNEPVDGSNCRPDLAATQRRTRANVTPLLFSRLNDGRLWWNYQGHANQQVLEHEFIYQKTGSFPGQNDLERFTNDGRPFMFSAFSCHANAFASSQEARLDVGPSIGEDMVTLPRGGAIASWASVGYEIVPNSVGDHLNVVFARSLFWQPPRDDYLGHGASVVLGEGIVQTLLQNYANKLGNPSERDVALTYTLLGDPATRLSIGAPQIVVTANHVPVTDGVPVFLPGQSDTLLLEAELVSNAAIDSIALEATDLSGTTILPASDYTLAPPFPDTGPGGSGGRRFHLSYRTQLSSGRSGYTVRTRDRYGVTSKFEIVFSIQAVFRAAGQLIRDLDPVARDAALTIDLSSPTTLDPAVDLVLTVDGASQSFTSTPNAPGRQFALSWTHAPYADGTHTVQLTVKGVVVGTFRFRVVPSLRLANLMSFPNPFNDDDFVDIDHTAHVLFTFDLTTDAPADLLLRVYTVTGRMIFEHTERGLQPGHHELAWTGRDAAGDMLANGVYLYHVAAKGPSGSATESGRLVKLRKPRRAADLGTP